MRRSFDTLAAMVSEELHKEPLSGDMFVFVGKNCRRVKVLFWDGTGLCVFAKRIEKGRFFAPWRSPGETPLRLTMSELQLFLEGSVLEGRLPLSPAPFVMGEEKRAKSRS